MTLTNLDILATLVKQESATILAKWREKVRQVPSARQLDTPTLNDHLPSLIEELAQALHLRLDHTIAQGLERGSPPAHGLQRLRDGFDIEEVVSEYNILRDCIHDLADSHGLVLQGEGFHILNRVLDAAIGLAVRTYAEQQALEVRARREEYLAFVAHDLRTPLNAIALAAQVLELKLGVQPAADAESARMFKTLRRNVGHLDVLVGKVIEENVNLEASTGLTLVRRNFELWPFVVAISRDLQPLASASGTVIDVQVPDELLVYADAGLMRRVFQNLITNAITYAPAGAVVVGARAIDGNGIECWVSDNGVGITPERLPLVFDKLETDPQKEDGLGLGLAIVKTFVEAHAGSVTVVSLEGQGSTFRFTLPTQT